MTLKKLRTVALSVMAVGAVGAIVFEYMDLITVAWIFCAIMLAAWLIFVLFSRCPECKRHIKGFELYCPYCGAEIDDNKKIF